MRTSIILFLVAGFVIALGGHASFGSYLLAVGWFFLAQRVKSWPLLILIFTALVLSELAIVILTHL